MFTLYTNLTHSVLLNWIHFILGLGPAAVGSAPNAAIFFCTYDREQIQSINYSMENQSIETNRDWRNQQTKNFFFNQKLMFDQKTVFFFPKLKKCPLKNMLIA